MDRAITKGIHHLGLTVSKIEESADFFTTLLGWKEVRRNNEYPAIYVSDGTIMISLWSTKDQPSNPFNKNKSVGLHHIALMVENESDLNNIHKKLVSNNIKIEFSPEQLGQGPAKHMICYEPGGIRVEFVWPGK